MWVIFIQYARTLVPYVGLKKLAICLINIPSIVKLGSTFFQMHLYICATIGFIKTHLQRFLGFVRWAHRAPNILQSPWV